MSRRALVVALALTLSTCATTGPSVGPTPSSAPDAGAPPATGALTGEAVLANQPVIPPLGAFAAPVPLATVLPNGLTVLVVERAGAPIEALTLVVKRGSTSDPRGKAGLASITAAMLEAGSAKKSQAEIAARADALGAELSATARTDGLLVSLSAQPSQLEPMARLLADVALRPNFDPKEWKKIQAQRVAQLKELLAEPRAAATNAHVAALYGDGPLGHTPAGTPASASQLTLGDVKRLWAGVAPSEAALVAVGAAPQARIVELATALFGGWKNSARRAPTTPPLKGGARPRLVLVEFPGRPQTVLQVGQPGVPLTSPDAIALRLMNSVLGGSFTSRLNANLREEHGYAYGAGSTFAFGRGQGPFTAACSVKSEVTGPALRELLRELRRIVDEPLPEAELAKGKALLTYGLVEQLQRVELTASLVAELFTAEAPLDSLRTLVSQLRSLSAGEVQEAARRALDPATMTITVAGDPKVLAQFEGAGLQLPAPERRTAAGSKL